jgi:Domain of unknown function (DUF1772)
MFTVLQITTVFLVAISMALALAHALELPGKLRLDKKAYYAVQSIYYPGFTIGGIGEAAGTIAAIILLFLIPRTSVDFWLTVVAVIGLIGMQGVYWIVTHPINQFWVEEVKLNRAGARFFAFGTDRTRRDNNLPLDWTKLRNRWEYSHVVRAACALVSFVALLIATSQVA